jgi:hypothetical protein
MKKLKELGVTSVSGLLMYANDAAVDVYKLDEWWVAKAPKILEKLR